MSVGPRPGEADLVAALDRQLRDKLAREGGGRYVIEGRLVTIRGEDHRCNSPVALRALLAAVEVLAGVAGMASSHPGPAEGPVP